MLYKDQEVSQNKTLHSVYYYKPNKNYKNYVKFKYLKAVGVCTDIKHNVEITKSAKETSDMNNGIQNMLKFLTVAFNK